MFVNDPYMQGIGNWQHLSRGFQPNYGFTPYVPQTNLFGSAINPYSVYPTFNPTFSPMLNPALHTGLNTLNTINPYASVNPFVTASPFQSFGFQTPFATWQRPVIF